MSLDQQVASHEINVSMATPADRRKDKICADSGC